MSTIEARINRLEKHQPDDGYAIALRYLDGFISWGSSVYRNEVEFEAATLKKGKWPELFINFRRNHDQFQKRLEVKEESIPCSSVFDDFGGPIETIYD
jgi:hypothetical protein